MDKAPTYIQRRGTVCTRSLKMLIPHKLPLNCKELSKMLDCNIPNYNFAEYHTLALQCYVKCPHSYCLHYCHELIILGKKTT